MVKTLLTILLIYLIFRLFSGWVVRYFLYRRSRHMRESSPEHETATGSQRKKIFNKEDGEYVDFEEIKPHNPHDQ